MSQQYLHLSDGDIIQAGDEFRIPLLREWKPIYPEMVGKTRPQLNSETPGIPNRFAVFRRPLPAKQVSPTPTKMPVVYVAGPFRAPDAWGIEQNIRRAETLALEVWRAGAAALCPHTNTRFFQGAAPDSVWLEGDLELLRRCDALVLVEGWEKSSGTRAEIQEARRVGIPVFSSIFHLKQWLTPDENQPQ